MGRFFQTTPTQFTQDFIYQPPWELIQQAATKKQQVYDNALATSKLFNNIPIQHLQGVDDVANVKEKQRYYAESADNIAKAIQNDPANAQHYMANLEALGKELSMDMKEGDLSKIQNSAIAYKAWQDDEGNKEMKKTDPARYAAAEKTFLSRYVNAGGNSISQGFKGEQITKDVDWKEILAHADKIKASEYDVTQDTASGLSIYTRKSSGKVVKKEDIEKDIIGRLIANPSNLAALRQSQDFGMAKYFDDETGALDYSASGFNGIRGIAEANAYSTQTSSSTISGNTGAIAAMNEEGQNRRFYAGLQHAEKMKALEHEYNTIEQQAKTKEEKLTAVQMKIAEATIANDPIALQVWTSQEDNLTAKSGIYLSNLGSSFGSEANLQKEAAVGNKEALKIIDQNLPQLLGKAGINYKDPKQKAIAEKVVGLYKQGKINLNGVGDFVTNEIKRTTSVESKLTEADIEKEAKSIAFKRGLTGGVKSVVNSVSSFFGDSVPERASTINMNALKDKIDRGDKSPETLRKYNEAKANVERQKQEKNNPSFNSDALNWTQYKKQAKQNIIDRNLKYNDENESFRNSTQTKLEQGLRDFSTKWADISEFSTTYETAPLSIGTQGSLKNLFKDSEISKEWFIEKDGKNEDLTDTTSLNFTSVTGVDGRGRNGLIVTDPTGKQFKITANPSSPAYRAVMNKLKSDVNINTSVGVSITYPTTNILKQQIEARKTLGQSNVTFELKSARGNDYIIKQVGNTDKYEVIDKYGKSQTNGRPVDYLNAAVMIDKLDSK